MNRDERLLMVIASVLVALVVIAMQTHHVDPCASPMDYETFSACVHKRVGQAENEGRAGADARTGTSTTEGSR